MIICSKCGETLPDDIRFCPSCGTGTATAAKAAEPVSEPAPAPVEPTPQPVQPEPVVEPVTAAAPVAAPMVVENANNYQNGGNYNNSANSTQNSEARMNFGLAIKYFITKIVDFTGRSGKREYWFGALFFLIVMVVGVAVDYVPFVKYAGYLVRAAACLAFVSATVRRIRDVGMPWTRIFFYLIPVYGQIRYFIELTK